MSKYRLHPLVAALRIARWPLAAAGVVAPGLLLASPAGGQVVGGQATIGNPASGTVVINQSSNSAIINWQQFSVGGGEYVVFNQPSASAAVLNRVVGGLPSEILGNLSANGRVFLINPSGVMFGQGARIDVGGLVASTLDIGDHDFMNGRYAFARAPSGSGNVSNAGQITARDGGFVVLAGEKVSNSGLIQAQLGTVALASGSAMTLGLDAQGLVSFSVDAAAVSSLAGVDNLGDLVADGGSVIMSAQTARTLVGNAVNNSGRISARTVAEREGSIYLVAAGGNIAQDGLLDVSGIAGADAGKVRISGDADIILTGNSRTVATGASGGDVRVVAQGAMTYAQGAKIDVSKQATAGAGGFVELSGREDIWIRDIVQLGRGGRLLIDPADFTIGTTDDPSSDPTSISEATLESQLRNAPEGSIVDIFADNSITMANLGDNKLDGAGVSPGNGGGLTLRITDADGFIKFDDVNDSIIVDGNLDVTAGSTSGDVTIGHLTSKDAGITVTAGGNVTTGNLMAFSAVALQAFQGKVTTADILVDGGDPSLGAGIGIRAQRGIQTGRLTAIHRGTNPALNLASSIVLQNNQGTDLTTPRSDIVTGAITASTVTNGIPGIDSSVSVTVQNVARRQTDGSHVGGGAVSTGAIALNAASSDAARADVQILADGNVSAPSISLNPSGPNGVFGDVFVDADNGGDVNLGTINAGPLSHLVLFSNSSRTSSTDLGSVTVGSISGTLDQLNVRSLGAVNLGTGALSANTIDISAHQTSLTLGNLTSRDGGVFIDNSGGSITTGSIFATSTLFAGEGFNILSAGIGLEARDGIRTGDLTVSLHADQSDTRMFGTINLSANVDAPVAGHEIVTGNLRVDLTRDAPLTGINAQAIVGIQNGGNFGEASTLIPGGNVRTGNIVVNAQGSAPTPGCTFQCSVGTFALTSIVAAGNIATQNIAINSSGASTNQSSLAIVGYDHGGIAVGNVSMSGDGQVFMQADAAIEGEPPSTRPLGHLTIGRLEGSIRSLRLDSGGDLTINADGSALVLPSPDSQQYGGSFVSAEGTVTLRAQSLQLAGALSGNKVIIETINDVTDASGGASIDAGGLSVQARRIDLRNSMIHVGSESMALGADPALLALVPEELRPATAGPNAAFVAQQGVTLGRLDIDGGYLFIRAPTVAAVAIGSESDLFYNYRPFNDTDGIGVPSDGGPLVPSAPSITFAYGGSGFNGDITVFDPAQALAKALDAANYVFLTGGQVSGQDKLVTNGQVIVLGSGPVVPPPQETPQETPMMEAAAAQVAASDIVTVKDDGVLYDIGQVGFEVAGSSPVEEVTDSPAEGLGCQ